MNGHVIPRVTSIAGWNTITIKQRDERLISLSGLSDRMIIKPMYHLQNVEGAINAVYLRESAAELLIKAADRLPQGTNFLIYDGWRPLAVQEALYRKYEQHFRQLKPELNEEELARYVSQFVSKPSVSPDKPSPHLTGGSVDLSLINADGVELDMGTSFDDFTERSETAYYEDGVLSEADKVCRDNRRLLHYALTDVGFSNYYKEWWHFDYGNQFWARARGYSEAFYGIISLGGIEKT